MNTIRKKPDSTKNYHYSLSARIINYFESRQNHLTTSFSKPITP